MGSWTFVIELEFDHYMACLANSERQNSRTFAFSRWASLIAPISSSPSHLVRIQSMGQSQLGSSPLPGQGTTRTRA